MAETAREDELLLVARSQRGDVDAFNQLVLRYQQAVFTVVMRMLGDRDIAADVTQETFLAAFRAMPSFRGGSSFRAWLMRIASNQSCDHWRRTHRHPVDSLDSLIDEDEPSSASDHEFPDRNRARSQPRRSLTDPGIAADHPAWIRGTAARPARGRRPVRYPGPQLRRNRQRHPDHARYRALAYRTRQNAAPRLLTQT